MANDLGLHKTSHNELADVRELVAGAATKADLAALKSFQNTWELLHEQGARVNPVLAHSDLEKFRNTWNAEPTPANLDQLVEAETRAYLADKFFHRLEGDVVSRKLVVERACAEGPIRKIAQKAAAAVLAQETSWRDEEAAKAATVNVPHIEGHLIGDVRRRRKWLEDVAIGKITLSGAPADQLRQVTGKDL